MNIFRSSDARRGDEEAPLLGHHHGEDLIEVDYDNVAGDPHKQFCLLVGIAPSDLPPNQKPPPSAENKLYARAKAKRRSQNLIYQFTASLSNALLLAQVVLGATLTALGAAASSHVLITLFGVLNTVIAGLVAYLKSRGQPMRARMFLDDLERVVDEIENSEIMWLGIARGVHGYDEIDIDDVVSVRSEVARLTRLYDKAVKSNTQNNPDMYMAGGASGATSGLRARQDHGGAGAGGTNVLAAVPESMPAPAPAAHEDSDDESPVTKKDHKSSGAASPKLDRGSIASSKKPADATSGSGAAAAKKPDPDEQAPASAKVPPGADDKDAPKSDGKAVDSQ